MKFDKKGFDLVVTDYVIRKARRLIDEGNPPSRSCPIATALNRHGRNARVGEIATATLDVAARRYRVAFSKRDGDRAGAFIHHFDSTAPVKPTKFRVIGLEDIGPAPLFD
jgi:hypothetical protein